MKKRLLATLLALVMALGLCVTTAWAEDEVTYLDADGLTKPLTESCATVTSDLTGWSTGWHVVKGDVTINDQLIIYGDAKLLLYDGATLTVDGDAKNAIEISSGGSLTVYGQSNQSGTLHAESDGSCSIVADLGSLTVNSGKVTARNDGSISSIIGNVTIAGGTVIAYCGIDGSVTLPTCHKWRTTKDDGTFTKNSDKTYNFDNYRTYVEIVACHDFDDWVTEIPATCTATGTRGHYTCSVCDKNFDANGVEITDLTIPATGHHLTHVDARAATRQEAGNIEYWQCSVCQQCFADENGQMLIIQADTVIAKLPPKNNNNNNSTPTTATTETVASPKTGDAGVLLSGALSVASLLGMGYVGRKR